MVEMALQQLSEKDVVHLDDERKAAMVSNPKVVVIGAPVPFAVAVAAYFL